LIGLYVLFFLHAYVDPYFAQSYWFPAVWLRELIGLNLNVEVALAMWGVALFVFGLIFLLYAVKHGKSLEKEFATMATPEDWLKKPENT
jgi:hypothetical protein